MNSDGFFTTTDILNYQNASKEIMIYLINMLNIFCKNSDIGWMLGDRIKSLESINEKIAKKKQKKGNDFDIQLDLLDIAGLRVVFCDKGFIVPSMEKLDDNIHSLNRDSFEREFNRANAFSNNHDIKSMFDFLFFLEKQNDNIIIIKDYITYPKSSGYQSLHVIFLASNGCPVEVQFRNYSQHLYNEFEHDIRYKKKKNTNVNYDGVFNRCSCFLRGVTESALSEFNCKRYSLTR